MSDTMTQKELDDIADEAINDILMTILLLPGKVDREELLSNILSAYAAETYEDVEDAVMKISNIGFKAMILITEMDKDGECRWHQTEQ